MSSAICFSLDQCKILSSSNGLSKPLASLTTFFKTSLIKFYHNSQQMSDSFYYIHSELNLQKKGPKHTHLDMFWNFCVG